MEKLKVHLALNTEKLAESVSFYKSFFGKEPPGLKSLAPWQELFCVSLNRKMMAVVTANGFLAPLADFVLDSP